MVAALVILALWVVLLGPGIARWLRGQRRTTSIVSFHRALRGLAVTGPKLVAPAHRLSDVRDGSANWEPRRTWERPHLVLLGTGANDKEHDMRYDGRDEDLAPPRGGRLRAMAPPDPFEVDDDPFAEDWDAEASLDAYLEPPTRAHRSVRAPVSTPPRERATHPRATHQRARHAAPSSPDAARTRRTRILLGLAAAIAGTFLLGLVPGLTILWSLTVLSVAALAGYLGLMYYASSAGLYGAADDDERRPVARAVVATPIQPQQVWDADEDLFDEDEAWAPRRAAAGR